VREILAIDLFRFGITTRLHQVGAERMTHRQNPARGLIVIERIFSDNGSRILLNRADD
jgi:hypothetical protein